MGKEVKYLAGTEEVGSWYNAEAVAQWESLCSACTRPQVQSLGRQNTKVGLLLFILILMSKFQSSLDFFSHFYVTTMGDVNRLTRILRPFCLVESRV